MLNRTFRGCGTALWGLLMSYAMTGYAWETWTIVLINAWFMACWGLYYAARPITWGSAGIQLVSVRVFTTLLYMIGPWDLDRSSLGAAFGISLMYGTWHFVVWMAPVSLMAYFFADWRARTEAMATQSVSRGE